MISKFDFLTCTIKHEHSSDSTKDFYKALSTLKCTMLLDELIEKMDAVGRRRGYEQALMYENITLMLPKPEKYSEQGIGLVFTSQGLYYFYEYLRTFGLDFRQWCQMWRALCFNGYMTKFTRVDYAMDDIRYNNEPATISMRRILNAIADGEMCCRAKLWSDNTDDIRRIFSFKSSHKRVRGEMLDGMTVQIGNRSGEGKIVRFYDKLTEIKMKRGEIPEACTSWTRCEYEFKGSDAMSLMNNYLDLSDDDFKEYMNGVVYGHLRFVERTSDNITRCPVKRWWKAFLNGCTKGFCLPKIKPARSSYARAKRGLLGQYLSKLYTFIKCFGGDGFLKLVNDIAQEEISKGRDLFDTQLANNIRDDIEHYEEYTAFSLYDYRTDLPPEALKENIRQQHWDYFQQFYKVVRLGQRYENGQLIMEQNYGM